MKKELAAEIDRVCALPEPEQAAQIKRLKDESGLELYCAKPQDARP